ncbi:MAG TPA: glycosyltransferase family 2 protein [Actinomycetota bacterium]|nr:glycosyltransferase family 2 protein [Actinomycetota bacterium]
MWALRLIAGAAAVAFFLAAIRSYRHRNISRLSLLTAFVAATAVVVLAAFPNLFDPVFDTFNFQPGDNRRLVALLLAAVVVLFLLLFRLQGHSDRSERAIQQLVEALTVERFDWDEAERRVPVGPKVVTISPAYNEAENVGAVIEAMPKEIAGYHVVPIVIDDRSDDGTSDAARVAGAFTATLPIRRGGGMALRVGYEIALQLGADIVVSLDADGQHLPEEIPVLIAPILEDRADHVNGSRMLGDFERGGSPIRHAGVHLFSWMVTILTGQRITDISSGYRATRAETLRKLILVQDQFWSSEITIEALRQRARIVEVPVTFLTRRGGESKKPKSLRYAWNFSKAIGKTWLR